MSKGFVREQDDTLSPVALGERPVSQYRNLVTPAGLTMIETQIAVLKDDLGKAEQEGDSEKTALALRDLRYWTSRRETVEVSVPDPESKVIRFGMWVRLKGAGGETREWKIVGEDEADAAHHKISHVGELAKALFGKGVGDSVTVNGKDWEIAGLDAMDEQDDHRQKS
jgi:transcription elongation GreA/GreB family factor